MENRISIKTDASYKQGGGVGIGYKAEYNNQVLTGRAYSEKASSSTEGEMLATAWSIHNFSERININPSDYTIVVLTDCENTIEKFESGYDSREMRILNHYSDLYNGMFMFWIPRTCNEQADAIAKNMLDKGNNND
jgi:hypothetical protein